LSRLRIPLLGLSIFVLLVAIWAGWLRLGWPWPALRPNLALIHGPLMVSGFLGTLVSLERAVALGYRWMYGTATLVMALVTLAFALLVRPRAVGSAAGAS